MTQEWISQEDQRWQMRCDSVGCRSAMPLTVERQNLDVFREAGWFIAESWGDRCPACVAKMHDIVDGLPNERRYA